MENVTIKSLDEIKRAKEMRKNASATTVDSSASTNGEYCLVMAHIASLSGFFFMRTASFLLCFLDCSDTHILRTVRKEKSA